MNLAEFEKAFKETVPCEEVHVNPLTVLSDIEFRRVSRGQVVPGYRERAIRRAIKARVEFWSDENMRFELARKVVRAACPYCKGAMEPGSAAGDGGQFGMSFHCPKKRCGAEVNIQMTTDGIRISPPRGKGA